MVATKLRKSEYVAETLGICLSVVYRMARSGDLPSAKFGRSVRFREQDIQKFILNNLQGLDPSLSEITNANIPDKWGESNDLHFSRK